MALDEVDIEGLRRCRNCGGKLLRATIQADLRKHVGHHLVMPQDIHVMEFVRIKLGWL